MKPGRVRGIYLAPNREGPPIAVDRAIAIAGAGLEGDRYARGEGTFSKLKGNGRNLTMIDGAVVDDLGMPDGHSRRNIETFNIDLKALIGQFFSIGGVLAYGARPCEPCEHLVKVLSRPELMDGLANRDGLRVDLLSSGPIQVGDSVRALGRALRLVLGQSANLAIEGFPVNSARQTLEILSRSQVQEIALSPENSEPLFLECMALLGALSERREEVGFQCPSFRVGSAAGLRQAELAIKVSMLGGARS